MKLRFTLTLAALAALAGAGYAQEPEAAPAPKAGAPAAAVAAGDPYGYGCDSLCYSDCNVFCDPCADRGGWIAGVGFYYLKPHWKANPAFLHHNNSDGDDFAEQFDFTWDYEVAPLIWFGYLNGNGRGIRVRYWRFDHGTSLSRLNAIPDSVIQAASGGDLGELDEVDAEVGDTLFTTSDIDLKVFDLEGLYEVRPGCYTILLGVGIRYVDLAQSYRAQDLEPDSVSTEDDPTTEQIDINHNFKGYGPTIVVEIRRPLGCNFAAYGSARTSYLYGDNEYNAQFRLFDRETGAVVDGETDNARINEWKDFLPIFELELGGEYSRTMGCREVFLQAAIVSQTWFGAGNASNNEALVGEPDDPEEVIDHGINMGFFGLKVAGGIRY